MHYIDAPIVRYHDHNTDGSLSSSGYDNVLYYLHDANFNVTGLVSAADGAVVERYMYKPYGKVTVLDPGWGDDANGLSDVSNDVLYCGYRYDLESGLYHVRHRYYHPTLGRWGRRDPLRYKDSWSMYEYTRSTPAGLTDPTGKEVPITDPILVYPLECPSQPPGDLVGDFWCHDHMDNPFHAGQTCYRSYKDGQVGGRHCCYEQRQADGVDMYWVLVNDHWDTISPNSEEQGEDPG